MQPSFPSRYCQLIPMVQLSQDLQAAPPPPLWPTSKVQDALAELGIYQGEWLGHRGLNSLYGAITTLANLTTLLVLLQRDTLGTPRQLPRAFS